MKKKNLISAILLSITLIYSFSKVEPGSEKKFTETQSGVVQDSFLLGAMHDYLDSTYTYLSDTLGFNVWHKYTVPRGWGWPLMHSNMYTLPADQLDTPVYRYSADIRARLDTNIANNLLTLMDRPKFQYLAFGQSSDYQCENISKVDPDYWFYTYYNSADNGSTIKDTLDYSNGGTGYVKRCLYNRSNPGSNARMLFDSLRGNMEQINTYWGVTWLGDSHYGWYIMPRIRIDSAFANNPANQNTEVCKVIIKNRDGDSITQVIKVRNFLTSDISKYSGLYLDSFYSYTGNLITNLTIPSGYWFNDDPSVDFGDQNCRVDFKVFWYDKCDMWIDRIRVEDEPAHRMLSLHEQLLEDWIRDEVEDIAMAEINSGNESPYKFYIEEFEMNHLPCIGYLNKKIIEYSNGRMSLMVNYNHDLVKAFIPNSWQKLFSPQQVKKYLIDSAGLREIFTECYNFEGWRDDEHGGGRESYVPTTLYNRQNYQILDGIPAYKKQPADYDDWIQNHFDNYGETGLNLRHILQFSDSVSRLGNVPFQFLHQAHLWMAKGHMLKEPTNEEMALTANLAISYGAKGLMYFAWGSSNSTYDTARVDSTGPVICSRGLVNTDYTPRRLNVYGQNKWEAIKQINEKIKKWDSYLMRFDSQRSSYIVRSEKNALSSETFFDDILTYKPLDQDFPSHQIYPETEAQRYLQVATFNDPNSEVDKFFMVVNRRCSPFNSNDPGLISGIRYVTVKLDSNHSDFSGFNNWSLYDLENDSLTATFDKRDNSTINLGWLLPGEGRLYKLAPVMQEGGTLVADEDCGGFEFECRGEVNNNGYDITIVPNTTILFANTSARIVMNGGSFHSGSSSESYPIYLKAKSGSTWRGLNLGNCEEVELHQTHFNGVSPYPVDSTYAVEFTDCSSINISNCVFSASSTGKTGSLLITYTSQGDPEGVYIFSNTFNLNTGTMPAVSVIATGYDEVPLLMELNGFESCSENSTLAILLSNVTGGAIKENNFSGYDKTVFMLGSSIDFYGNYIIGSDQSSVGIVQHSASNANLSASGEMFTGGYNSITAEGQTAKCIQLSNSYLLIDEGYNNFKLEDSAAGNFHLEGTIPNDLGADPYPAESNCFEIGYVQQVKHNLRWIDETPINLDAVPTNCNTERPDNLIVFNLENGINDTIRFESGGSGGGERAIRNYELGIKNYENSISENLKESVSNAEVVSVKALSDSVSINLRKRHYEKVSALCREMLTDYADSIKDASLISKLYLAELKLDTNQIRMSELKSFLESYILNNPEKEMMIRQAFYFIQKCKVSLGLYESAMTGFQQIINQFPYSYEGLLASWDYAATSLLNTQGGSGGGATSKYDHELRDEVVISYIDDPNDVYDSRKFSTDDRKTLNENLTKTFSSQVKKQSREIKSLEERVTKNEATNGEKKKYQEMRTLKEVVKIRKPGTVAMHVSMISDDLSRVMKSTGSEVSDKYEANILPTEFALHQNYPNPFNPATKISFDLPQDSRVSLVVYDLLGREVAKLVSNEFKVAGNYTYDFNAASLSSGVYFYKLVVSSSNPINAGNYSETKRMVLLK